MAAVAGRSHGVIAYEQLLHLGLSPRSIGRRLRRGWLTELFPGAYAVGHHNLTRRSYWWAAVISAGVGAVLSHRSAARLWRMASLIPGPPHVTIPERRTLGRDGIVVHRTRDLPPTHVTLHHGIRVTTPARTLLDFSSSARPREIRDAVAAAERLELLDVVEAARLCDTSRGRAGTARLRTALQGHRGPVTETRSPLEDLFLPICGDFGIRMPRVNAPVLAYEVDCLWMPERLIVELDGWEWHKSRESFEADRRRDAKLGVAGYHVHRATRERLVAERAEVAGEVASILRRLRASRTAAG